jgi:pimeloyl-ACP methyl ester carboxylesterase
MGLNRRNVLRAVSFGGRLLPVLAATLAPGLSAQRQYADVNGTRIYYEAAGSGSAVVLIHGWALNSEWWDDQLAGLAGAHRVIRYDRRGFGRSPGLPDVTADPADLAALLTHLGIERAHVVGHSQGGVVALGFAVNYPDRTGALILYGSGPPFDFGVPPGADSLPFGQLAIAARTSGVDSVWRILAHHPIQQHDRLSPEAVARVDRIKAAYTAADLKSDARPSGQTPPATLAQLAGIRAPTLVLTGDAEIPYLRLVADTFAATIPGARRVVIPGGGHMLSLSRPAAFNAAVLEFVGSVEQQERQ